jgi:hypothetical protein
MATTGVTGAHDIAVRCAEPDKAGIDGQWPHKDRYATHNGGFIAGLLR